MTTMQRLVISFNQALLWLVLLAGPALGAEVPAGARDAVTSSLRVRSRDAPN